MKVVIRLIVSFSVLAALAAGCGSNVGEPAGDTTGAPDGAGDARQDVAVDVPGGRCETNADCAARLPDIGPCQVAVCQEDGTCAVGSTKDYDECDDGDACSLFSVCVAGVCTALREADCDDGNPCTTDLCLAATGCRNTPAVGTTCDDGDPCTGNDACDADGVCEGGDYVCEPCDTDADCADFEDGDLCNGTLACVQGTCRVDRETVVVCDPSGDAPCQETRCVPQTGACETATAADGSACEDGNACTRGDTCAAGACVGGEYLCGACETAADCAAYAPESLCLGTLECVGGECRIDPASVVRCPATGDPCVVAYCDAADGSCKTRAALTGTPCDDGDVCTTSDRCRAGTCEGRARPCDDGDACTTDVCDALTGGCVHVPRDCDDQNPCTADSCDALTGQCRNAPRSCDDQNPCTIDTCDAEGECQHTAKDCADEDPCTQDRCDEQTGICSNPPVVCTDGSLCTTDSCDSATGHCRYQPVVCDDGLACTTDVCDLTTGQCRFTPIPCDDQNGCTTDACDPQTGTCRFTPIVCADQNPCTLDTCNRQTGACEFPPVVCDDRNACTTDTCDPEDGACQYVPRVCDDDDPCTDDSCDVQTGCAYAPRVCDDQRDCTVDSCDPTTGECVFDDSGCPRVEVACENDVDDDGDGLTDCDDPDCDGTAECIPQPENDCDNDLDDDGDGLTDCDDPDCTTQCLPPCVEDAYEENDDVGTAFPLAPGDTIQGASALSGDLDVYALEVCGGGVLDLRVEFPGNANIDLYLVAADGTILAESATLSTPEILSWRAPADGTYYAVVELVDEGGCASYNLRTSLNAQACGPPTDCEPGFALGCGGTIEDTTEGLVGRISTYGCAPGLAETGPERIYAFTPDVTADVRLRLTAATADLDLFVLAGVCDPDACVGAGVTAGSEDIVLPVVAGTTYFLVVEGYDGAAGPFSLSVECLGASTERDCANGIDDDGDGAVDCDDDDCAAAPSCAPVPTCGTVLAPLTCGATYEGTTVGGTNSVGAWGCVPAWAEPGPDVAFPLQFETAAEVTLRLTTASGADLDVFLLAGDCAADACVGYGDTALTFAALPGQGYFAVVDGYGAADVADAFTLTVECAPLAERDCANRLDDDGDGETDCDDPDCEGTWSCSVGGTCTPTAPLACGGSASGTTEGATGGIDFYGCSLWDQSGPEVAYTFVAAADGPVTFALADLGTVDLDLFVLAETCAATACVGYGDTRVTIQAVAGTTYHVVVDGYRGAAGSFTLTATCAPPAPEVCDDQVDNDLDGAVDCADPDCAADPACEEVCLPDAYEPDDDAANATELRLGVVQSHSLCPAGDADWYTFTLAAAADVVIRTDGPAGDTVVVLYDDELTEIASDDDGGAGAFSLLEYAGLGAGTYYVEVIEYGQNDPLPSYLIALGAGTGCAPEATLSCGDGLVTGTTVGGTSTIDAWPCTTWDESGPEVIYELAVEEDTEVTLALSGLTADLDLLVLVGTCSSLSCGLAVDSEATFLALAGETYYVVVDGYQGAESDFTLGIDCQPPRERVCDDGVDNDGDGAVDCADADCAEAPACTMATCEAGGALACDATVEGTTVGAAADIAFYACQPFWDESGPEVAYTFTVDVAQEVTLQLGGLAAGVDLDLFVLADTCDSSACAVHGDALVRFSAEPGTVYYVVVDGYRGAAGAFTLAATCATEMVERLCDDGLDNDADGATDCDDPDCAGASACVCGDDIYEENDDLASATPVVTGGSYAAEICPDDEDWYAIEVPAGCTVSARALFDDDLGDLDMELVSAQGIIVDTSTSTTDDEEVSTYAASAETYYAVVYGYAGARNTYELRPVVDCRERLCDDELDNDGDGDVDCDDEDCADAPVCHPIACEPVQLLSCGDIVSATNAGGTTLTSTYSCVGWNESGPEVLYAFVAGTDDRVTARLSGTTADLDVFVFNGTCDPAACAGYGSTAVTFGVTAGETWYVVVDGYNGAVSEFALEITCASDAPENCSNGVDDNFDGLVDCDDPDCEGSPACLGQFSCEQPGDIEGPGVYGGSTQGLPDTMDAACQSNTGSEAIWLLRTPAATNVCLDTVGSAFDTVLYALTECAAGAPPVACNDDAVGTRSRIQFAAEAETDYYVVVDGWSTAAGAYTLNVRFAACDAVEDCAAVGDEDGDGLADCLDPDCANDPACACADASEPNETPAAAAPIELGQVLPLSICPATDADWFTFTLDAPTDITLETAGAAGDTVIALYDADGVLVAENDDVDLAGGNRFSRVTLANLAAGTYFAVVIDFGQDGEIPAYTLSLFGCIVDAGEPDVGVARAVPLLAGPAGVQTRSICPAADVDWYVFTLAARSDVVIETSGAVGDTVMDLWDAGLTLLASDDDGGEGAFSRLEVWDLPAGAYYVTVGEYLHDETIAAYDITLKTSVLACPADDAFEPNDTLATARLLSPPATLRGVACPNDDDWYAVTAQAGCVVSADLLFRHADGDLDLRLVTATNSLLSAGTTSTDNEHVEATVPADGTYYVRIYGFAGASARYALELAVTCRQPEVCDDDEDNDLDGAVDCDDADCADDPACRTDDEYEDNDSFAAAVAGPLAADGLMSVYGDEDWFWYDVCAAGTITVDILFSDDLGDLDLYLYDAQNVQLDSGTSTTDDEQVAWTNGADTPARVYVRVRNYTSGSWNAYDLIATLECPESCGDGVDNDGDGAADCADEDCVGAAGCPALPAPTWGQIQWPDTTIEVAAGGAIPLIYGRVYAAGVTEAAGKGFGLRGQLGWGERGTPEAQLGSWTWTEGVFESQLGNDDQFVAQLAGVPVGEWGFAWRFTTDNGATWLYADLPPGSPYAPDTAGHLIIRGAEVCDDTYDNDGNGAADCDDEACAGDPACATPCVDDAYEDNDTQATATPFVAPAMNAVMVDGDLDWYSVTACAGAVVTFTATFDPATDIDIHGFDQGGTPIGSSTGFSGTETFSYPTSTAQTLAVRVREYTTDACAAYVLTIAVDESGCQPAVPVPFISQYVEGGSFNKALEITNAPGAADLDLTDCVVRLYFNGQTTFSSIALTGADTTLSGGESFVICHAQVDSTLFAGLCDQSTTALSYNGDDAVALVCGGTTYDVIGQIGVDPGAGWTGTLPNSSTVDRTLVRRCGFYGDPDGSDPFNPDTEWTGAPINSVAGLGVYGCAP